MISKSAPSIYWRSLLSYGALLLAPVFLVGLGTGNPVWPAGMLFCIFMPHAPLLFSILVAVIALTLVAFNHYVIAFGTRCALRAVVIIVAGHSIVSADARMINVVMGSAIGIVFVLGAHFIGRSIKGSEIRG